MGKGTITIRIDDEIDARLQRLADQTHRTKSFYIREAILEHLDDIEDVYLADKRLEDTRTGKARAIPLEEVMLRYDLEN